VSHLPGRGEARRFLQFTYAEQENVIMSDTITPIHSAEAKSKVETVLAALRESWNRHDMVAFAAQFTQDADFVNVIGMHERGRSAIEALHIAIHKTMFRNSQLRTLGQSVRFLTPQVAVAHVDWEMTGHESPEVEGWTLRAIRKGVLTAVLVAESDNWRITALHNTDTVPVPGMGK
jgi:uncharacterized protein (TIGR02246 family)